MANLSSLDDVFYKRIFRIPDYQRGYAWTKKQLTDFWDDLVSLDQKRLHYTGVLTIKPIPEDITEHWNNESWLIAKRSYRLYFVVDGQQRLTTISIFLQALIEHAEKLNVEFEDTNLQKIKEKYIVVTKPPHEIIRTYLFGYEVDNPSFEFMKFKIFNEPSSGAISETFYTLNLENAKTFFSENISNIVRLKGTSVLEELYSKLTQNFMFNLYEIEDDFDVFVAFETMNNRGKSLSDLELLKNRLIYLSTLFPDSQVKKEDKNAIRKNINDAWKEIYYQLGKNKNRPLSDDEFLKAHWIMYFKYSRKKGDDYIRFLLDEEFSPKKILENVPCLTTGLVSSDKLQEIEQDDDDLQDEEIDVLEFNTRLDVKAINDYILSLKSSASHWYNLYNPENNTQLTEVEAVLIDRLNRIGIGYFRPLLMASFVNPKVTPQERLELLKGVERFIFIAFRVMRAISNYGSSLYYRAARELYYNETSATRIIADLNDSLLSWTTNKDGTFKFSSFRDYIDRKYNSGGRGFYGWNGLNYFLFEYEEEVKKMRNDTKIQWKNFVVSEKDKVSVEHIYPQTDSKTCWEEAFALFTDEQKMILQGSLGNLLPLSARINSSLQNDCFSDKKNTKMNDAGEVIRNGYANGSFSELEVAKASIWSANEIRERGIRLLKFMERRWDIRFANEAEMLELLHLSFLDENPSA